MLRPLQNLFPTEDHPDLLVGLGMPDDAAVYKLDDERALIVTTDFFTPIVDDAYQFGAIAAANALSDVYAMGGAPLLCLNIVAFPMNLSETILADILRGGAEKVREAGSVIAGGHSIKDNEPKYGLVAIGTVHPDQLLTKANAQPGDVLILTKPLGTGIITTALKNDKADESHLTEVVGWMQRLNRDASMAAVAAGATTATDVTGFGLIGHAAEIARSSKVTLEFQVSAVPYMFGVHELAQQHIFPGGSADNLKTYKPNVDYQVEMTFEDEMMLYDAQTSGGLLIALAEENVSTFEAKMHAAEANWWQIGHVREKGESLLRFIK